MVWIYLIGAAALMLIGVIVFKAFVSEDPVEVSSTEDDIAIATAAIDAAKATETEITAANEELKNKVTASVAKESALKETLIKKEREIEDASTEKVKAYLESEGIPVEIIKPE